jgi:ATP-binding cassette subfamily F protein 3
MRYTITNGTVSVGGSTILSHIDFEIKGSEKLAVVGRNGAGKTTLLRLIAGELELDRDDRRQNPGIKTDRKLTVGMLHQSNAADHDKTVEELLLAGCPEKDTFSKERFLYEMEYDRLFTGFGFEKTEKKRKLSSFSGGEQTKISLIRLLLEKPDILLLDEPTNHLDIPAVEWLEQYMQSYDRAVVFVSHDRFFLDQVAGAVYELQDKKLKRYAGNYTAYRKQKQKDFALQKKAYERQQEEIARLNELIAQFKNKAKKAAFARSRKTILERMEKIECPREDDAHMFTGPIDPLVTGSKWVLEAEHLKIGYDRALLELSLKVRRGQKIGIIGANGSGKSTFLKTVAGLVEPLGGKAALGNNTLMGYFDQQSAALSSEKRVLEHFHDLFPKMTEKEVRQTLGAYLFSGRDAAKKVDDLSGGEKARLVLAELLCSRPNLLLLDEPTNHMDIPAKETLESAFSAYTGTILFVSHDRYFIEQVADAILVFEDGRVMYYPFGYAHYIERRRREEGGELSALVQAENQALVADLKAVPKAERHRLKEISTEDAYEDWKLRLAAEPLETARERCEQVIFSDAGPEEMEQAEADWTDACLNWYDLFLSLGK